MSGYDLVGQLNALSNAYEHQAGEMIKEARKDLDESLKKLLTSPEKVGKLVVEKKGQTQSKGSNSEREGRKPLAADGRRSYDTDEIQVTSEGSRLYGYDKTTKNIEINMSPEDAQAVLKMLEAPEGSVIENGANLQIKSKNGKVLFETDGDGKLIYSQYQREPTFFNEGPLRNAIQLLKDRSQGVVKSAAEPAVSVTRTVGQEPLSSLSAVPRVLESEPNVSQVFESQSPELNLDEILSEEYGVNERLPLESNRDLLVSIEPEMINSLLAKEPLEIGDGISLEFGENTAGEIQIYYVKDKNPPEIIAIYNPQTGDVGMTEKFNTDVTLRVKEYHSRVASQSPAARLSSQLATGRQISKNLDRSDPVSFHLQGVNYSILKAPGGNLEIQAGEQTVYSAGKVPEGVDPEVVSKLAIDLPKMAEIVQRGSYQKQQAKEEEAATEFVELPYLEWNEPDELDIGDLEER